MKPTNQITKIFLVGLLSLSSVAALAGCSQTGSGDSASEPTTETTASGSAPASTATSETALPSPGANATKADATKTEAIAPGATTAEAAKTGATAPGATTAEAAKTDTTTAAAPEAGAKKNNLVELAASEGNFKTLTAAIEAAGLSDTLKGDGPFTVFAPTDEAFAALPAGTLDELLKPENKDKLIKVLTYHVVPQQVASKDITPGEVKTVEGEAVKVEVDTASNEVRVNEAKVTKPDVQASNGVIHVVDKVILPPDLEVTPGSESKN